MKIFIDTLDLGYIEKYSKLGILSGVTTNPTFSKQFEMYDDIKTIEQVKDILQDPHQEIHIEILEDTVDHIINRAKDIHSKTVYKNLVFKIPFSEVGLEASRRLVRAQYKTNLHLIYSVNQALLAVQVGTTYVCPLFGRLDDIGTNALEVISNIQKALVVNKENTKMLLASIRNPKMVSEAYEIGIDSITIPPKILDQMMQHPLTQKGILQFKKDLSND